MPYVIMYISDMVLHISRSIYYLLDQDDNDDHYPPSSLYLVFFGVLPWLIQIVLSII